MCLPQRTQPSSTSSKLDTLVFLPHPDTQFLSTSNLHGETRTSNHREEDNFELPAPRCHPRQIHAQRSYSPSLVGPSNCSHDNLVSSKDKLYFVQYTLAGTMTRRWYLVQINMAASHTLDATCRSSEGYYFYFLAKHPSDAGKTNDSSRWWPDWYRLSVDPATRDVVFGDRVIF